MANLISTITETISLNGKERGSVNTLSIGSVTEVFHRIVTVPATKDATVALFATTTADDTGGDPSLDGGNVKYIRVTNLSATSSDIVNLSLQIDAGEDDSAADESATIALGGGESFIMNGADDYIAVQDTNEDIETTLHDLESLLIDGHGSNNVTVEVFIAC